MTAFTVAQPQLNLSSTVVSWPTVELYFKASCDSIPAYHVTRQNFRIRENGVEVPDFTLWCPDSTIRCAISVSIVLDAGMSPSANATAKMAGKAFIDVMDGVMDEASIIWFNSQVNIQQQMTTIKPLLYAAVSALPSSGSSAIWDGAYAGIVELINNGVNQCRAMILITDGFETSSGRTLNDVISLAQRNRIRVHAIGVGQQIKDEDLRKLAEQTGGTYMTNPDANKMHALYVEISSMLSQVDGDCVITYQRYCADGALRQVELSMPQFCRGSVSDTMSYQAPLDSSTFSPMRMKLFTHEAMSGDTVRIPLYLPNFPGMFPRFQTTLQFDERYLQFLSVQTPSGTYLESVPIDTQRIAGGILLETLEDLPPGMYPFSGVLCELYFRVLNVTSETVCTVKASNATFASGCLLPEIETGTIAIFPKTTEPVLRCDLSASTITVDEATDTYHPMPFSVECHVKNVGSVETAPMFATLSIQPDLAFDSTGRSGDSTSLLSPATMKSLETASVSWVLWHPVSRVERRYAVTVTLHSGNTDSLSCTTDVVIPPVDINPFSFRIDFEGAAFETEYKAIICTGDSVTLDAGAGYAAYLWNTGARTRRILVSDSGRFSCDVTDSTGLKGKSNTVSVEVERIARTKISMWGSLPICSNDSLILSVGPGWPGSRWNTGDTTYRTTAKSPGLYYATIVGRFGCIGYTDTVEVTTIPAPPKPVITRSLDDLMSTEANRYQWQKNGSNIPGATERTCHLTASGIYRVQVFAENGCSALSDPYVVSVLSIHEQSTPTGFTLDVRPNPITHAADVIVHMPRSGSLQLRVHDLLGRMIVVLADRHFNAGHHGLRFDATGLPRGLYLLRAVTDDQVRVRKMIVR